LIGSFTRVAQPIFQVAVVAAMIVAIGYGVSRYFGPKALSLNERISSARQKKADDNKAEEAQKKDTAQSMKQIANGLSQIATNMGPAGGRKAGPLANAADENNARGSQLGLQEPLPQNGNTAQNGTTPASAQTNPKAPITGANVSQQTGWIGTWPFLVLLVAAAGVFTVVLRTIPQQNAQ